MELLLDLYIASILFCKRKNINFWFITDIAVLGVSAAYVFGRIGNFFNQELVGRVTDVSWGIYVDGILRHPSQLYEAFLEGIVVFLILVYFRNRKKIRWTISFNVRYFLYNCKNNCRVL